LIEEITFGDYLRAERSGELASLKETARSLFSVDVEETVMLLSDTYQNFSEAEALIAKECQSIGITPISFRFVKSNIADSINAIRFLTEDKFSIWPLDDKFQPRQEETVNEPVVADEIQDEVTQELAVAPTTGNPSEALTEANQPTSVANTAPQAVNQASQTNTPVFNGTNNLASRDQAFQELRRIAEYFKATEPHSPISFLLERAIRWGYMSLPELLQEMTGGNSNVMEHINQLTGMDNLDKVDLAGRGDVVSPIQNVSVPAVKPVETTQSAPSSVSLPSEESTPTQPTETEKSSTESSGNLNDFEW